MDNNNAISPVIESATYRVGALSLHCLKIGSGKKLVLAFHGYGNDASLFTFLNHDEYLVVSFDLPFQGKSQTQPGACLEKNDLVMLTEQLMQEYGVRKIGLLGFSLGARVCLCIAEQMPEVIRNMVLVAPDGVRHNYFYRFFTGTLSGRSLFRSFVKRGNTYLKLFSLLHQFHLLDKYKYRFALQYIRTDASRRLLSDIWMATRKLIPDLSKVKREISEQQLPVHILMGQQDGIIPLKNARLFKKNNKQVHIHVFERGHNLLHFEEVRGTVAAWLFRTSQSSPRP